MIVMQIMNFDNLSPTDFEKFCYDLLLDKGFKNLNWRKGSDGDSSPSDSGRDIECYYYREDVDGKVVAEKWFVECKHYNKSVPYNKISSFLSTCLAERPDRCLIIVSSFLSNSAKNQVEIFNEKNRPPLKINTWERVDIERLTIYRNALLRKYGIKFKDIFLNYLNPYHVAYIKDKPFNSLYKLMKAMDKLDAEMMKEIMNFLPLYYLSYELKTEKNVFTDTERTYKIIQGKCLKVAKMTSQALAVSSFVFTILDNLLMIGNPSTLDEIIHRN